MSGLDGLLTALQTSDNATRQAAEERYRQASEANLPALVSAHLDLIQAAGTDPAKKRLASILLRRVMATTAAQSSPSPSRSPPPPSPSASAGLAKVCATFSGTAEARGKWESLLKHVYDCGDVQTTKQVVDVVVTMLYLLCKLPQHKDADVATVWPSLFQSLVSMGSDTTSVSRRVAAMELWLQLCVTVNSRITRSQRVLGALYPFLLRRASTDPDMRVRIGAIKTACCVCIGMHPAQDTSALQKFAAFFRQVTIPTLSGALSAFTPIASSSSSSDAAAAAAGAGCYSDNARRNAFFALQQCLSYLIELVENRPIVFPVDAASVQFCGGVLQLATLDRARGVTPELRSLLVELFVALAQRYRQQLLRAPGGDKLVRPVVGLFMKMICTGGVTGDAVLDTAGASPSATPSVEDVNDSDWGGEDRGGELGEEGLSNIAAVGYTALDRVANAFGAAAVLPCALSTIGTILREAKMDWRRRWAVMAAATALCGAEHGGRAEFTSHLPKLLSCAAVFARDDNFFVQYAAVNFLYRVAQQFRYPGGESGGRNPALSGGSSGQSAKGGGGRGGGGGGGADSQVDILLHFGGKLLPVLGQVIVNHGGKHSQRVRARACRAVSSFHLSHAAFTTHRQLLDKVIVGALLGQAARETKSQMLQAAAVAAVALYAREMGPRFGAYAAAAAPVVVAFLRQCSTLAGLAASETGGSGAGMCSAMLECIGMMADSLGPEQFMPAAKAIVPLLFQLMDVLQGAAKKSSPGTHSVLPATIDPASLLLVALQTCVRVARALQASFARFLLPLVKLLLEKAALNADPVPVSAAEAEAEALAASSRTGGGSSRRQFLEVADGSGGRPTLHGIDTVLIEEKALACNLLYVRVKNMLLSTGYTIPLVAKPLLEWVSRRVLPGSSANDALIALTVVRKLLQIQVQHVQQEQSQTGQRSLEAVLRYFYTPLARAMEVEKDIEAKALAAEAVGDLFRGCCVASHKAGAAQWDPKFIDEIVELLARNLRESLVQHDALSDSVADCVSSGDFSDDNAELELYQQEVQSKLSALVEVISFLCTAAGYVVNMAGAPAARPVVDRILSPQLQPWMRRQPGVRSSDSSAGGSRRSIMAPAAAAATSFGGGAGEESFGWEMWRCTACLLADLVEFANGACASAASTFLGSALSFWCSRYSQSVEANGIGPSQRGFLQAALYGIGLVADLHEKVPNDNALSTARVLQSVLSSLAAAVQRDELAADSGDENYRHGADEGDGTLGDALDNGVAALGKFILHRVPGWTKHAGPTREAAVALSRLWLSLLPLRFDPEEAVPAHANLMTALEDPFLFQVLCQDNHGSGSAGSGTNSSSIVAISVCLEVVVMCSSDSGTAAEFVQRLQAQVGANGSAPAPLKAALQLVQQRGGGRARGPFAAEDTIQKMVRFVASRSAAAVNQ